VELHAMGFVEAHEGEQSLRIKFYLTDDSQAGNSRGLMRCAGGACL
jgi:senataxin